MGVSGEPFDGLAMKIIKAVDSITKMLALMGFPAQIEIQ
jgi:hypothetical protein